MGEGDEPHRWENWDPSAMVRNEEWQNQRYYEKMSNYFLEDQRKDWSAWKNSNQLRVYLDSEIRWTELDWGCEKGRINADSRNL